MNIEKIELLCTKFKEDQTLLKVFPQHSWYAFLGFYYGYPTCCIQEFCHTPFLPLEKFNYFKKQNNYAHFSEGTGFVPCKECLQKNEFKLYQDIVSNRFSPAPFLASINNQKFLSENKLLRARKKENDIYIQDPLESHFYQFLKLIAEDKFLDEVKDYPFLWLELEKEIPKTHFIKVGSTKINVSCVFYLYKDLKNFEDFKNLITTDQDFSFLLEKFLKEKNISYPKIDKVLSQDFIDLQFIFKKTKKPQA